MTRIVPDTMDSPRPENAKTFDVLQRALGTVPNMALTMGAAPAVLTAWAGFNQAMSATSLSAETREQIAILTAEKNACTYCLAAHTALGHAAGIATEDLDAARDGRATDPAAQAALNFARDVIDTRGGVSDASLAEARTAGLSDQALAEVVAIVALNSFTNFFNRAFEPTLDFPEVARRPAAMA